MEDLDSRIAPLMTYAALVCGGVIACLLLLAGPAQAEGDTAPAEPERSGGLLPLDEVGQRVAETTRRVGTDAGSVADEVVHRVAEPVRRVAPSVTGPVADLVEDAGRQATARVGAVTDGVAEEVERVTDVADAVVDEQPVAPAEPTPAVPDPPDPAPGSDRDRVDRPGRADTPRARTTAAPDRAARAVARAGRAQLTLDAAPASYAPTVVAPAPAPTAAVAGPVTDEIPSLALLTGCGDCAAAGGSSGDPLHVFGLPTSGLTTPRSAGDDPRGAGVGGPATVFRQPDVSPD